LQEESAHPKGWQSKKIEFVTSNLPAWFKKAEVAANLLSHLFTSGENSITLGFVKLSGNPK
jgi:hypothetical protein